MPSLSDISAARWAAIKLLATDVDGVLTDGSIHVASDGVETKTFSVLDGLGMVRLLRDDVVVAWISGRASGATTVRATELKIPHIIQGRVDKHTALTELADALGIELAACVYVGDDDIDAGALRLAGIGVTVPDAMPAAVAAADCTTTRRAGAGAVREICEQILAHRGQD
ncbi:KdsC family phosphatase [Synoicihabitans lomoniglobus]|uniref:HAD hydrolase family protein n=1 Tax=Synoicihabitans lomoniglobus TaxID=2909285 RepID=A0AAF0CPW9_9BACT|nr:HAD hydrolase family protein [Opitutaceae bacterium LMO-M01]WED65888.1 HAD hydrolase family protein [Opitutaceae bacterium LMO-M01]